MAQRLLQLAEMQRAMGWERVFRDRTNPLDTFNDAELVKRYRFSCRNKAHHGYSCFGH